MALTITVAVFLKRNGDPELVYNVPPTEQDTPSEKFQDASDYHKLEPVPGRTGGRKQGDDGRNDEVVYVGCWILTGSGDAGGLFGLGGSHG